MGGNAAGVPRRGFRHSGDGGSGVGGQQVRCFLREGNPEGGRHTEETQRGRVPFLLPALEPLIRRGRATEEVGVWGAAWIYVPDLAGCAPSVHEYVPHLPRAGFLFSKMNCYGPYIQEVHSPWGHHGRVRVSGRERDCSQSSTPARGETASWSGTTITPGPKVPPGCNSALECLHIRGRVHLNNSSLAKSKSFEFTKACV